MDNYAFMVNEEPYCIYEHDLRKRNLEFLKGIDVGYFDFVLQTMLQTEDEKRASINLRLAYYHALETLFSLIGALVQSPYCVYGWIAKCHRTTDLKKVIEKIGFADEGNQKGRLIHAWSADSITWDVISGIVFRHYLPSTKKNRRTSVLFAKYWRGLAKEFLNECNTGEYNSLKHGFRVRPGGFALMAGSEKVPGEPAPPDKMSLLGASEFGSSYITLEPIGDKKNRCLKSKSFYINWPIEGTVLHLQLISMSINNVISALQILNGEPSSKLMFQRPKDDKDFERAWFDMSGIRSMILSVNIDETQVPIKTKKDLLKLIASQTESK